MNERLQILESSQTEQLQMAKNLQTKLAYLGQKADGMATEVEKTEIRLRKLESARLVRETKISLLKQFWPFILLIMFAIDYNKIIYVAKSFVHLI